MFFQLIFPSSRLSCSLALFLADTLSPFHSRTSFTFFYSLYCSLSTSVFMYIMCEHIYLCHKVVIVFTIIFGLVFSFCVWFWGYSLCSQDATMFHFSPHSLFISVLFRWFSIHFSLVCITLIHKFMCEKVAHWCFLTFITHKLYKCGWIDFVFNLNRHNQCSIRNQPVEIIQMFQNKWDVKLFHRRFLLVWLIFNIVFFSSFICCRTDTGHHITNPFKSF